MREIKGKFCEVINERPAGNSHIRIIVQQWKTVEGKTIPTGPRIEAMGGFKYAKDFQHGVAFQCALENAVGRMR